MQIKTSDYFVSGAVQRSPNKSKVYFSERASLERDCLRSNLGSFSPCFLSKGAAPPLASCNTSFSLPAVYEWRRRRSPKVRSRLLRYKRGRASSASLSLSSSLMPNPNERRNETDVTTDYEMRFVRWKFGVRSFVRSVRLRIHPRIASTSFLSLYLCRSAPRGGRGRR